VARRDEREPPIAHPELKIGAWLQRVMAQLFEEYRVSTVLLRVDTGSECPGTFFEVRVLSASARRGSARPRHRSSGLRLGTSATFAAMNINLCVLLWTRAGQEDALVDYEDPALDIAAAHGVQLVSRVRRTDSSESPFEVQVLRFPSQGTLDMSMQDPARLALSGMRDAAVARTAVARVEQVPMSARVNASSSR